MNSKAARSENGSSKANGHGPKTQRAGDPASSPGTSFRRRARVMEEGPILHDASTGAEASRTAAAVLN